MTHLCWRVRPGHDDGQASVEMAVSLMIVTLLVFWLFEVCMFMYTCGVLNNAAVEGVRYAIMHGTDSTICSGPDAGCTDQAPYTRVQAIVKSTASASRHDLTAMTVTVSYDNGTAAVGNPVEVKVLYTYVPYIQLPGLRGKVSFSSRGQIIY